MTGQQHVETRPAALPAGRAPAFRVLVTGSRAWRAPAIIHRALGALHVEHPGLVVVHGACTQGADAIADRWALLHSVTIERHPAQWRRYGRSAGPRRNAAMVQTRPDLCLAFIRAGSTGASQCAHLAHLAGIPVQRWTA